MTSGIVTLLTDFGLQDTFVGQMKGSMLARNQELRLVDLTHDVPPQSILTGAWHLRAAWTSFPAGTTHLVVVDPEVGSHRRAIGLRFQSHYFVGPDNGVFHGVLAGGVPDAVVELDPGRVGSHAMSQTFHGRDLFAPAAAEIASGTELEALGTPVDRQSLTNLGIPEPAVRDESIRGTIVIIDHYGNAITNISVDLLRGRNVAEIRSGQLSIANLSETYSSVATGRPVGLISSMDTLELAVRDGSAAERYDLQSGVEVIVDLT